VELNNCDHFCSGRLGLEAIENRARRIGSLRADSAPMPEPEGRKTCRMELEDYYEWSY